MPRTVAVDFDGVLHPYTRGWVGSVPDDEAPMQGAHELLAALVDTGFTVVVFSTRADHGEGHDGITAWLERHQLAAYIDRVTHEKPPAVAYVDDRAVRWYGDWEEAFDGVMELAEGRRHGASADA